MLLLSSPAAFGRFLLLLQMLSFAPFVYHTHPGSPHSELLYSDADGPFVHLNLRQLIHELKLSLFEGKRGVGKD